MSEPEAAGPGDAGTGKPRSHAMTLRLNAEEVVALDRARRPRENRTDAIRRLIAEGGRAGIADDLAERLPALIAEAMPEPDAATAARAVAAALRSPELVRELALAIAGELAGTRHRRPPSDAPRRATAPSRQSSIFDDSGDDP